MARKVYKTGSAVERVSSRSYEISGWNPDGKVCSNPTCPKDDLDGTVILHGDSGTVEMGSDCAAKALGRESAEAVKAEAIRKSLEAAKREEAALASAATSLAKLEDKLASGQLAVAEARDKARDVVERINQISSVVPDVRDLHPRLAKVNKTLIDDIIRQIDERRRELEKTEDALRMEELDLVVPTRTVHVRKHKDKQGITQQEVVLSVPPRTVHRAVWEPQHKSGAGVRNIVRVFRDATPAEVEYWSDWYYNAHSQVMALAHEYDIDEDVMCGVVAVLSPGNKWVGNLVAARAVVEGYLAGERRAGSVKYDRPGIITNAYTANIDKAIKFLEAGANGTFDAAHVNFGGVSGKGEFADGEKADEDTAQEAPSITGPKVTVFYESLANPQEVERNIVTDSHAINIWLGKKKALKDTPAAPEGSALRKAIEDDYKKAASKLGLPVQHLQAITWYIWKYTQSREKATAVEEIAKASRHKYKRRLDATLAFTGGSAPKSLYKQAGEERPTKLTAKGRRGGKRKASA
jgi:hypothetical protein